MNESQTKPDPAASTPFDKKLCPKCGAGHMRRSKKRRRWDWLFWFIGRKSYTCSRCEFRSYQK